MKKKVGKIKRITACTLAAFMLITANGNNLQTVHADDTEAPKEENTETGTSEGEDGEEKDEGSGILKPKLGTVEFWEWNKVTKTNFDTYMDDDKFHASLLFYYDTDNNRDTSKYSTLAPKGFISLWDDKEHIKRGISNENWKQYWDKATTSEDTWNSSYRSQFDWGCSKRNFLNGFAERESSLIKLDSIGKNLNGTGVYFQDRFFTTENGSMGALYIKSRNAGTGNIADLKSGGHWTQWSADVSIYLARGEEKGKSVDTALSIGSKSTDTYLECGKGMEGKQPGIYVWKGTGGGATSGGVKNQSKSFLMFPFMGNEDSEFWVGKVLGGMNHDQLDYAKVWDNDQEDSEETGPTLGVTHTGYLVAYDAKPLNGYPSYEVNVTDFSTRWSDHTVARDIFHPETTNVYAMFKWYVGTRHVYTSFPTQEVPEGKFYPFSATTTIVSGGDVDSTEGIIIPKGETLTINGGTVSVECNLINNGKIVIKNGGTLIIKDGGIIAPFTEDAEGTIDCEDGSIVVMPGGKMLCLQNSTAKNAPAPLQLTNGSSLINYGYLAVTTAKLDTGSAIENRKDGVCFAGVNRVDKLQLMNAPKIKYTKTGITNLEYDTTTAPIGTLESYKGNYIDNYGYSFKKKSNSPFGGNSGETQYLIFSFDINLKSGEGVKMEVEVPQSMFLGPSSLDYQKAEKKVVIALIQSGFLPKPDIGMIGINGKANFVNERTATFNHGSEDIDYATDVNIITPEY